MRYKIEFVKKKIVSTTCFMEPIIIPISGQNAEKNNAMVEKIRRRLKLTSLEYQRLEDLVEAIGSPKEKVCTHCWDGSSYF
jgi:hypothetical protein